LEELLRSQECTARSPACVRVVLEIELVGCAVIQEVCAAFVRPKVSLSNKYPLKRSVAPLGSRYTEDSRFAIRWRLIRDRRRNILVHRFQVPGDRVIRAGRRAVRIPQPVVHPTRRDISHHGTAACHTGHANGVVPSKTSHDGRCRVGRSGKGHVRRRKVSHPLVKVDREVNIGVCGWTRAGLPPDSP